VQAFPDEPLQKHGGGNVNGGDEEGVAAKAKKRWRKVARGTPARDSARAVSWGLKKPALLMGFMQPV